MSMKKKSKKKNNDVEKDTDKLNEDKSEDENSCDEIVKVFDVKIDKDENMFINMRKFLAVLWAFELLLHFDHLFSFKLQFGDKLCTNHKYNYLQKKYFAQKMIKQ